MRGTSVIPKSNNSARIASNFTPVELSQGDFDGIDSLRTEGNSVRRNNPVNHIGFDIYNEGEDEPTEAQERAAPHN